MRQLPFLLPPLKDQERFAAFVEQSDKSKFNVQIAIYRDVQGM